MPLFTIQIIAAVGSALLILLVLELVRRKVIREEYALLWLICGVVFFILSVWRSGLDLLAKLIGIAYAPAAILLLLLIAAYAIMIQFSIVISSLTAENKRLAQEIALLRVDMDSLRLPRRKKTRK